MLFSRKPTCTKDGSITYVAEFYLTDGGNPAREEKTVTLPALGHLYDDEYKYENSKVTVTRTCSECGDVVTEDAPIVDANHYK